MSRLTLITLIGLLAAPGIPPAAFGQDALFPPAPLPAAPLFSSPQPETLALSNDKPDAQKNEGPSLLPAPKRVAPSTPPMQPERIAPGSVNGDFPALPPDPYAARLPPLPPLEEELWLHGGSQLYQPEGDRLNWPSPDEAHYDLLRLPENWRKPRPLQAFADFVGPGPIPPARFQWPGTGGYAWEPRFVGFGSYELFGFALKENNQRQDVVGHQLLADLDLRLTGTERFHVQFRPVGMKGTGGSYYQFSDPEGYVDNATGKPDRFWFEAELHSLLGAFLDPNAVRDYNVVLGQFPFALHNSLLINDDILGFVISKNTLYMKAWSNVNVQVFGAYDEVDAFPDGQAQLYGGHVSADRNRVFYEATYAFLRRRFDSGRNTHYAALSRTQLFGPTTLAGRALFKYGDRAGSGSGQLFVLESNRTRVFDHGRLGVEKAVFYGNLFWANDGWTPISGGNFNRLRTSFATNPLVRISAGAPPSDTWGAACGVQLFRHDQDESWVPEVAYEQRDGQPVAAVSLRYLRKTGARTFLEAVGVAAFSDDSRFERRGVFASHSIVF